MKIAQKRADELTTDDVLAGANHDSKWEIKSVGPASDGDGTEIGVKSPSGALSVLVYGKNARVEVVVPE